MGIRLNRTEQILKYADLSRTGIEVAPYFNPAVRKSDGYKILTMDVFDTTALRERALKDSLIPNERVEEIEEVDLVGDASQIGELVAEAGLLGRVNYIVSSHNFEHLPNPILFLQGACNALEPGGVLSMAVPDCRACFDYFRMPTRLVDWLAAFHEDRRQPSPETLFETEAQNSSFIVDGKAITGCNISLDDPSAFKPNRRLLQAYESYKLHKTKPGEYHDAHCSVFFPESLELLLTDLRKLNLIDFDVLEISETVGLEFFVHLRKPEHPSAIEDDAFYERRHDLLVRVSENLGAAPYLRRPVIPNEIPKESDISKLKRRLRRFWKRLKV